MVRQKTTIRNLTGLTMRSAEIFCKTAMQFPCKVTFQYENVTSNAKSLLSVLGACVKNGAEIELVCEGEEEQFALESMVKVIQDGLGE